MKFGLVTKFNKENKTVAKEFKNNLMSANSDVIVIFPIYGQFGAIRMYSQ